jgi:hypothetical protein
LLLVHILCSPKTNSVWKRNRLNCMRNTKANNLTDYSPYIFSVLAITSSFFSGHIN